MKVKEEILFYAFRYALGRQTYVAEEMVKTIKIKWGEISKHYKTMMQKEIKTAIEGGRAGAEMDVTEWKKILILKNQL